MKIAFDISPTQTGHKVRGVGFYTEHLKNALVEYSPSNTYYFFGQDEVVPKDADLIHYPYFDPFFLTLPFFKEKRTVVTIHDMIPLVFPEQFPKGFKGNLKWQLQLWSLRSCDAIITDSQSSRNDIERLTKIPHEKITVVPLSCGPAFRKLKVSETQIDRIEKKYHVPEKFVLYVGDGTWNKNLPRLIRAVKKANITLVMVGKALANEHIDATNPWNNDLLEVAKLTKNDDRFLKLGFVPTTDLVTLYNMASVFVMPSLYEGFGLGVLEAMACGTPVVTTEEGSLSEVGGKAVYYVDAYSNDSIADGIAEVFFTPDLQKNLSEKGLKQAKKFSWEKTAKETLAVYDAVVK